MVTSVHTVSANTHSHIGVFVKYLNGSGQQITSCTILTTWFCLLLTCSWCILQGISLGDGVGGNGKDGPKIAQIADSTDF